MQMGNQLSLPRCPQCGVAHPTLKIIHQAVSRKSHDGMNEGFWALYGCSTCGDCVMVRANTAGQITRFWPPPVSVAEVVPERARTYLEQAINSIAQPAGSIMLAASAIDSMLKAKELKAGSLYTRIDEAAKTHLITSETAAWAHEIRLDANDQRHADEEAPLPSAQDAKKAVEFAQALAQFLFVLPARVARGRGQ